MALGNRTAEHGEILAEHIDQTAIDRTRTRDHAVARNGLLGHAEIDAVVLDVSIGLFEAVLVEQDFEPLARGQLALGVLRIDAALAAAHAGRLAALFHFGDIG